MRINKSAGPPSLMRSIMLRIAIGSFLIVVVLTAIAYWFLYANTQARMVDSLQDWVVERARNDSSLFELAEDNLEIFRREYLRLYNSDAAVTEEEFWSLFARGEDGEVRLAPEYFDGVFTDAGNYHYGMTGFIGDNQPVDDPDLQRRLVLAYRLTARLGPAWANRFANLQASFPENAFVLFWPGMPWGLEAGADLRMNELSVTRATLQSENPERNPVWTGLDFDETVEEWTTTYQLPVDHEGRHLINPSHDVPLTALMQRLVQDSPEGGHNFIIRSDGYLVAHPAEPTAEQQWVGQLSLEDINNPAVVSAYELINDETAGNPGEVSIIDDEAGNSYLAVSELAGPDWWFVSVYPKSLIRNEVNKAAGALLLSVLALLVLLVALTSYIIRRDAEKPLWQLQRAAQLIGQGGHAKVANGEVTLPRNLNNEIGQLANAMHSMSVSIRDARDNLEQLVEKRTLELEEANTRLRELSLLDGLLGIHNRRSFDRDVRRVFEEARRGEGDFFLLLVDIDSFKLFNDIHGHVKGDRVLKLISESIQSAIRDVDRVYRYGGEELAVIFNHTEPSEAHKTAERVMKTIRDLGVPFPESEHGIVTVSAGFAEYRNEVESHEDIVGEADRKMYESKDAGRNRLTT